MTLTDEGERFLPIAQNLVNEMDVGLTALRNAKNAAKAVRIGYIPAFMYAFLADAMLAYHQTDPAIEVEFTNASPSAQVTLLERRQLDIACVTRIRSDLFSMDRVAQVPIICALSRDTSAPHQPVSLKKLRNMKFIIPDKREYPFEEIMVRRVCRMAGFEPKLREVDGIDSVLATIGLGEGIGVMPAHFSLLPHPTVRWENLSLEFSASKVDTPTSDVYVVTRDLQRPPHLQRCIDSIKDAATKRYETRFWQPGILAKELVVPQPDRRKIKRRAGY